jgi:diguanylate cyclase (GGDEF)-like protein
MTFQRLSRKLDSRIVLLGGVAMAVAAWFIDAAVDSTFFEHDTGFWQSLLQPDGHEIWMRGFLSIALILLGAIAALLLKLHESAEQELGYNRALLEKFAKDLEVQNAALLREIGQRKEAELKLSKLATTDPLTGIYNRRKFDETLQDEIKREARYKRGLALIIIDIDRFKKINDNHGHDVGDQVLIRLADLIKRHAREADSFFRIGGEEFALISYTHNSEDLHDTAERLRVLVEGFDFEIGQRVTVSLGASRFLPGDNFGSLYKRTDEALYQAKGAGRNRVVLL